MDFRNIVIMKYGVHVSESIDSIITRKMDELQNTGVMYWGYGGTVCHPRTQVQPFVKANFEKGEDTYLLLVRTPSENHSQSARMEYYTEDGTLWEKFPEGINVLGSKYAIVCESLNNCDIRLDLSAYRVAAGRSAGKSLAEYLRGRVDKACAVLTGQSDENADQGNGSRFVQVSYWGRINYPGAVFCKE
ncbi:MAG: hypothetical protein ACOX8B_09395 [Lachnospiraceae bacterium]|jgi:hypothetical protein